MAGAAPTGPEGDEQLFLAVEICQRNRAAVRRGSPEIRRPHMNLWLPQRNFQLPCAPGYKDGECGQDRDCQDEAGGKSRASSWLQRRTYRLHPSSRSELLHELLPRCTPKGMPCHIMSDCYRTGRAGVCTRSTCWFAFASTMRESRCGSRKGPPLLLEFCSGAEVRTLPPNWLLPARLKPRPFKASIRRPSAPSTVCRLSRAGRAFRRRGRRRFLC